MTLVLIVAVAWALWERYRSRPMYAGHRHPLWAKWQAAESEAANHRYFARYWRRRYELLCQEQNDTKRRAIRAERRAAVPPAEAPDAR